MLTAHGLAAPRSILIRPLDGMNGFLAYAIGVDGLIAEGRTEEETLANLKAALERWTPAPEPQEARMRA
jgi:predicted RNase H-like HicB family nuclease